MSGNTTAEISQENYEHADLADLLKQYYKRLFPTKLFCKWLQYGEDNASKKYLGNREFSFTLKDDIYIRYLSFNDHTELEKELVKKVPFKIDIGAVYNYKPKDHKTLQTGVFKPMEKELVFDIDMTDYDEVRKCCSGAAICGKCWPFMTLALNILDAALEEDFGFNHRLWVYSGRRGIHCWVGDESARKLSQPARSAIAEYLTVIKGGESQSKKVTFKGNALHPSISRAKKLVADYFENHYIEDQDMLTSAEDQKTMLKLINDDACREKVETLWNTGNLSNKDKWKRLRQVVEYKFNGEMNVDEIMFQYVYPRLDVNVSKGLNHLLKSPFCIHPKTGRVCIPIDPKKADEFDPLSVPTISQLFAELDASIDSSNDANDSIKKGEDYLKTTLAPSIKIFQTMIKGLEKEYLQRHREDIKVKEETGAW